MKESGLCCTVYRDLHDGRQADIRRKCLELWKVSSFSEDMGICTCYSYCQE